jgi:hypothetical protein
MGGDAAGTSGSGRWEWREVGWVRAELSEG